mmetsp:Transcript_30993/g.89572  ORF Transcript_30993/g.89572 Transcript_30993/m.89572 type:complete len:218 (-) Transcript_30993:46-699(-)
MPPWPRGDDFCLCRLLLLGDSGVGKSSLMLRFATNRFSEDVRSTIGMDFRTQRLTLEDKQLRIQIWDMSGQERFRSVIPAYLRHAEGVVIVYDVTDRESFNNVRHWLEDIELCDKSAARSLLVGNKSDLLSRRVVTYDDGRDLAEFVGIPFMETSARDDLHVQEAFVAMAKEILMVKEHRPRWTEVYVRAGAHAEAGLAPWCSRAAAACAACVLCDR